LAGFPSGENGAWTFCEIAEGDFISFLYGARAHNLYEVSKREALRDALSLPPWEPLTFRETGRTYSFHIDCCYSLSVFSELLVRTEFAYVAENLLFCVAAIARRIFKQTKQLCRVFSKWEPWQTARSSLLPCRNIQLSLLRFTRTESLLKTPEIVRFRETILQAAFGSKANLALNGTNADDLEILGEKALPEGHIDLLLKRRVPLGSALKIPIEVKTNRAQSKDLVQLRGYMNELHGECPIGVLIASDFGRSAIEEASKLRMKLVRYSLSADLKETPTFQEISGGLTLSSL
jgi:hypothetical protein